MHVSDKNLVTDLSEQIKDGPLQGAVYARFSTGWSFGRWLTPLGNYLIARPGARARAHDVSEQTEVPLDGGMVLGVGTEHLHIWSADIMLGQVHKHLGAVGRSAIAKVELGVAKS